MQAYRLSATVAIIVCGCVLQTVASYENATVTTRQAIGVALVQSGALNGHAFVNNKTRNEDKQHSCNKTITHCDPFISQQAKLEQENMKNIPSNFNITESAYNASIVHALKINQTMVTRNKTIIYLQNQNEEKPKKKPVPSSDTGFQTLNDLVNFTIPLDKTNKTITINSNRSINSNSSKPKLEVVTPLNTAKDFNLTIPKPAIMNNHTMDVGKVNIVNQTAPNIIKTLPLPGNKTTKLKNNVSSINNGIPQGSKHGPFSEVVYNQHLLPSFQNFQTYRLGNNNNNNNNPTIEKERRDNGSKLNTNSTNSTQSHKKSLISSAQEKDNTINVREYGRLIYKTLKKKTLRKKRRHFIESANQRPLKKKHTNARLGTKRSHSRKARYAFDYDSDRDSQSVSQSDPSSLPVISNFMDGPDLVPLKDDPADSSPDLLSTAVKGRSDIWTPIQNEEAEKLAYTDGGTTDRELLTEPRGHIALPDATERAPVFSESVPPNSFVDNILSGRLAKNPDRLMEKQFIPVDGPMKTILKDSFSSILTDDKPQFSGDIQPKQIVPSFGNPNIDQHDSPLNDEEARILSRLSPKTAIMSPDEAERRYEEEKLQDEELGMMLDKFDRETKKIASLYKYLGPKADRKHEALRDYDDRYQESPNRLDVVNNRDTVQSGIGRDHLDMSNRGMSRDYNNKDSMFPSQETSRNYQYESEQSNPPVSMQRSFESPREFEPLRQSQPSFTRDEPYDDQSRGAVRNNLFNTPPQIESPRGEYNDLPPPQSDESERNNFYGKEQWRQHESHDTEESYNRARIMKELLNYIKDKAAEKSKQLQQQASAAQESFHHEEPPYPVNPVSNPIREHNYPDFRNMYNNRAEEVGREPMEHEHAPFRSLEDMKSGNGFEPDHSKPSVSYPNNILDFIRALSDVMHGKESSSSSLSHAGARDDIAANAANDMETSRAHSLEDEEAINRDDLPLSPLNEHLNEHSKTSLEDETASRDTLPNTIQSPVAAIKNFMDFSFKENPFIPPDSRFVPRTESTGTVEQPPIIDGGKAFSELLDRNHLTNRKGMVMLLISAPNGDDALPGERKESVQHKELTPDGVKRVATEKGDSDKPQNEDSDFSKDLKTATDFVLGDAVKAGNITKEQRDDIEEKLGKILDAQEKNMTKAGEDKAEKFITDKKANITASSMKILHEISGEKKSVTPKMEKKLILRLLEVPADPVMYLAFDVKVEKNVVPDSSGNHNDGQFENKADMSTRVLGTCGKAAELNEGSVTWSGENFKRKPTKAVTIAMWVKTKKNGVIDWFASKKGHKVFYTKSNGTVIPSKVWTHVAGTFDTTTGLARIYINGILEQESQQSGVNRLPQNWLVNGIGSQFGDDSMQYVDELFIYDRALNISEIRTLVNRCVFNRMIFHYGFANGNKTNTNDQSGLENDGILTGGAKMRPDCGRCGACLDLQAGPDPSLKIQQVSVKNLPRVKVSIAVWVSLNDTKGVHNIFKTESSKGNIGYNLQVKNGRIRWYIASDKGHTIFDNMTKNEVVPEALWTHIIVSYNNENGKIAIYTNSLLKLKDTVPEANRKYLPINWDNDASIGDNSFHGYLDEFIMYNWELDGSEALYVRNYCADHPKLVRFTVRVPLTKKSFIAGGGDEEIIKQNISFPITLRNMVPILLKTKNVFTLPFRKGDVSEKVSKKGWTQSNAAEKSKVPAQPKYPNPIIILPKGFLMHKKATLSVPKSVTSAKTVVPIKAKPKAPIAANPNVIKTNVAVQRKTPNFIPYVPPKAAIKTTVPAQQNLDPFLSLMPPKAATKTTVPNQQSDDPFFLSLMAPKTLPKLTPVRAVVPNMKTTVPLAREIPPKTFVRPKTYVPKRINPLAANIRKTTNTFGAPRTIPKTLNSPRIAPHKTFSIPPRNIVRKQNPVNIRATAKSIISLHPKAMSIKIPTLTSARHQPGAIKRPPGTINRSVLFQKSKQPRRANPAWFSLYKKLLARKNSIHKRTFSHMNLIARREPNVIYDMLK